MKPAVELDVRSAARFVWSMTTGSPGSGAAAGLAPAAGPVQVMEHLVGPTEPELSCDECFELLDVYVELELANRSADAQMPLMRAHLKGCAACRDDYDSLLALLQAGQP